MSCYFTTILVGASNGHLAIYELRQNKCQMIPAHTNPITALAFSPDGKFLVSYSCGENRLSFWQTSTGTLNCSPFFSKISFEILKFSKLLFLIFSQS